MDKLDNLTTLYIAKMIQNKITQLTVAYEAGEIADVEYYAQTSTLSELKQELEGIVLNNLIREEMKS